MTVHRPKMRFLHQVPNGADWRFLLDGSIVVAVPGKPPYVVRPDGSVAPLVAAVATS